MKRLFLALIVALSLFSNSVVAQVKVACVGNSVTYGYKLDNPVTDSYPAQLQQLLGDKYEVGKFGRSGATLLFNGHNPYIKTEEYQGAKSFEADIVVIHLGLNDTDPRNWPEYKDQFATDYSNLIDSLTQHNKNCRVIIARMSPIFERHPRFDSSTRDWYNEIQQEIENVAKYRGVELIDFQEILQSYPSMLPDALHPDKEGAGILAKRVYSAITGDFGGLQMPITYADNMVLQRGESLRIAGTANAGDKISVNFGKKSAKTTADYCGKWEVALTDLQASSKPESLKISSPETSLEYNNVLVGDVWLASGQSNMERIMPLTDNWQEELKSANFQNIRVMNMTALYNNMVAPWNEEVLDAMNHLDGYKITQWSELNGELAKEFSAVAYYFAQNLRDTLEIPIGVISNAVGGTTAEAFVDRKSLEAAIPSILRDWPNTDYIMSWAKERGALNIKNKTTVVQRHYYEPAFLFESGIQPLDKFPIKGAIWYQGESNANNIQLHSLLFKLLVQSWRDNWDNQELPFYFVQLSSIATRGSWPEFRNSQRLLADEIPNTAMAVCSDIGHETDVHPRNKSDVGKRLALIALKESYVKTYLRSEGPKNTKAVLNGEKVELTFENCSSLTTSDRGKLVIFEVAEIDGFFVEADAKIEGNKVILSNYGSIKPTVVRYGWQPYSLGNLVNEAGLPCSTFKTEIEN